MDNKKICLECGAVCCKAPFRLNLRPDEMRRFVEISPDIKTHLLISGQWRVYFSDHGGQCPHLDDDNLCKIYPVRPLPCRTFPEPVLSRASAKCPLWEKLYR